MHTNILRRARRERGACRSARRARHRQPLRDPDAGDPAGSRRHRPAREVADGLGQDARLRDPARRAGAAGRRAPCRARPRPDARAVRPGDRGDRVARRPARPRRRVRLRRRLAPAAGEPRPRRSRDRRHARPSPGPGRSQAHHARRGRDPRPRRGRPDARHGLQATGRPDRQAAAARAPDDVLLRDARRRGRRARPGLHPVSGTHRGGAAQREDPGRDRPPLRTGDAPTRRSRSLSSCSPPSAALRSSSFARSAAPTVLRGS